MKLMIKIIIQSLFLISFVNAESLQELINMEERNSSLNKQYYDREYEEKANKTHMK